MKFYDYKHKYLHSKELFITRLAITGILLVKQHLSHRFINGMEVFVIKDRVFSCVFDNDMYDNPHRYEEEENTI